jgi:hypothetical protein
MLEFRTHYFSTQGWRLLLVGAGFEEPPLAAAAAAASFRALRSKKLAILFRRALLSVANHTIVYACYLSYCRKAIS